jgi:prophage antirepressor-like protein
MNGFGVWAYGDMLCLQTRLIDLHNGPWFLARDVAMLLFGRTTSHNALRTLKDDEKHIFREQSVSDALSSIFQSKAHTVALISESGLYKLIMRSDKPEGRAFQDWVTGTVMVPADRPPKFVRSTLKSGIS